MHVPGYFARSWRSHVACGEVELALVSVFSDTMCQPARSYEYQCPPSVRGARSPQYGSQPVLWLAHS